MSKRKKQRHKRPAHILHASKVAVSLIASFEGFRPIAYKPVPEEEYWSIGYGHYGPDVEPGDSITREEGRRLLRRDLAVAEAAVRRLVRVPISQGQFDALTSFTFNVGAGALAGSTLLRKLNKGRHRRARWQLHRWVFGASGPLLGLVRRRKAEARLWRTGRFKAPS